MTNQFEQQKNIKAGGYTLIIITIILLLFILISWRVPLPEAPLLNEGIEVNLGNSDFGRGDIPPTIPGDPAPEQSEQISRAPKSSPPPAAHLTSDEDNNDPDALELPKTVVNSTKKPKPQTNNNAPAKKVSELPPAPPQPKPKATMGAYKGGTGTGGNNQDQYNSVKSQGIAGGSGDQGKPNGNINSDNYKGNGGTGNSGVSISRGLTGRAITSFPSFEGDFNENAKIAVDIKVNEDGRVISAVYLSKGSTSSSGTLKSIAIKKAKELKFNKGEIESLGTVVFNFRLKG